MIQRCILAIFFLFLPFGVLANNLGIAVDQAAIAFDVDTGETQEFIIKVQNLSDVNQKVVIEIKDYVLGDNNNLVFRDDSDEQNGLKEWIEIRDKDITLTPDEKRAITFIVRTPENAPVGSHRGAVVFRAVPAESDDTVKVQGQIGVHILINVKGDTHASGHLNSFDVPFITSGQVEYVAEFENTGNIHYVPYGEVTVRNVFTRNEQTEKYDKHFVFPGKKYTFTLTKEIPSLFGFYRAQVTFVDGEGVSRTRADYTMGYFFPLIFIGAIIFIIILIRVIAKKRQKNVSQNKKEHKKTPQDPKK